jgi:7-cyano-7-deazaguanine synthase
MPGLACVLLSGGLDSTAALYWALERYDAVRAIGFAYGQPHRDAELALAGRVSSSLGVPYTTLALADALATGAGLVGRVEDHRDERGLTNAAFVPGRNVVFLSLAAAHACVWEPSGRVALVIGACAEDAAGFPDCRRASLDAIAVALRLSTAREIDVVSPFHASTKADILRGYLENASALADLRLSWSCYRGARSGPCSTCTACIVRARAFAEVGVRDASVHPALFGGDPHRGFR